jgi:hypothetical protein
MEHITNAGNVEVPAYLALQQLGFALEQKVHTEDSEFWIATKNGLSFSGSSTLEVLGLCLMRSTRGAEWKATDEEINRYLRTYYPDALKGSDDEKCLWHDG